MRSGAFLLVWASLILAPAAGLVVARSTRGPTLCLVLGASGVLAVVIAALAAAGFRLIPAVANIAAFAFAYTCFCLAITAAAKFARPRLLRWSVVVVAAISVLPGYLLGIVGALALSLFVAEKLTSPARSEPVGDGLRCETSFWGMAATESGYAVEVYEDWRPFPLRRRLVRIPVNETRGDEAVSCADALAMTGR